VIDAIEDEVKQKNIAISDNIKVFIQFSSFEFIVRQARLSAQDQLFTNIPEQQSHLQS